MQIQEQRQIWKGWKNMNRKEVISVIKRNHHEKRTAIRLISDFLMITREEAEKIYLEEFGNE